MIKITGHRQHNYTLLIDGNDGEEQLVIVSSCGQNGETVFSVVATQIDLGMKQLTSKPQRIKNKDVPMYLRKVITTWVEGGIPPAPEELKLEMDHITTILSRTNFNQPTN